jgi:hypothetical protein
VVSEAPLWLTIPLALLLAALAAASAVMARGGFAGSLTRKNRMGVHSPAAMASDEAFTLANRVAAPVAGGAAVVALLSAVLMIFLPLPAAAGVVVGLVGLVGSMVLLLVAGVLGDRAARQVPIPARKPSSAGGAGCSGCACGSGGCAGITRTDPAAAGGQA